MSVNNKNSGVSQFDIETKKGLNNRKSRSETDKRNYRKQKQTTYNKKQNFNTDDKNIKTKNRFILLPLIFVIALVPLIMRMKTYDPNYMQFKWFPDITQHTDFFLYFKQWIFVTITLIMLSIIIYKAYRNKKYISASPIFIPLGIYALLNILSAIFSKYSYFSIQGSMDQFESLFAILGYCTVVYYAFLFIQTEEDMAYVLKYFVISILILSVIGIGQFMGKDIFASEFGQRLILSKEYWGRVSINLSFGQGRVYLTLFNPNYVGVYVALVAPVILILLLFSKKLWNSVLYAFALIGLIICVIGAESLAGLAGLVISLIGLLVFLWRYIIRRYYIFLPIALMMIITLVILNGINDNFMINRIRSAFDIEKTENNLTNITTKDDVVSFKYKGNEINISMIADDIEAVFFIVIDESGATINHTYDENTGIFSVQDERYPGITFHPIVYGDYISFNVKVDGYDWKFTNKTEDGTYYHHNRYGKLDKIVTAPSAVFTGYETLASRRGYLWSRTIPLIKDYIVLGSGPDTFTIVFPQQDYVNFVNYSYFNELVTKPHSLYLQIAIQSGLLSLIAFLVFYGMYFVTSVRLYIKGRFNSYYAQVGVAIFIGTISYMVTGLTNDSSITTAPVFWALIGMGIVANIKARPLIMEEHANSLTIVKSDREKNK